MSSPAYCFYDTSCSQCASLDVLSSQLGAQGQLLVATLLQVKTSGLLDCTASYISMRGSLSAYARLKNAGRFARKKRNADGSHGGFKSRLGICSEKPRVASLLDCLPEGAWV